MFMFVSGSVAGAFCGTGLQVSCEGTFHPFPAASHEGVLLERAVGLASVLCPRSGPSVAMTVAAVTRFSSRHALQEHLVVLAAVL